MAAALLEQGRFFVPGPTEVRPEIMAALSRPMIFHRSREMEQIMRRVTARLGPIFGTRRPVHILTGSGTSAMELAVRGGSLTSVLSVIHGDFGERFARMAEACDRRVERLVAEPGDVVPLDRISDALRKGSFDAVTVTHSETSLGVLAELAEIGAIVREHQGCMLLVDAVSSAGAASIEMDKWGLDAVVTASQKALALPPGLAFAAVSERFVERASGLLGRGIYLDIVRYEEFTAKNQSPTTPAVPLIWALDEQLAAIEAEGLAKRFERHAAMAAACVAWAESKGGELGVSIVACAGHRSPSVSCLRPRGAPAAILQGMRDRGYELGGGQAPLARETFRIGHMGDHTVAGVQALLGALTEVLRGTREPEYRAVRR